MSYLRFSFVTHIYLSGLETWKYGPKDSSRWPRGTLYPQKLALASMSYLLFSFITHISNELFEIFIHWTYFYNKLFEILIHHTYFSNELFAIFIHYTYFLTELLAIFIHYIYFSKMLLAIFFHYTHFQTSYLQFSLITNIDTRLCKCRYKINFADTAQHKE
jgi:hypothetical protein